MQLFAFERETDFDDLGGQTGRFAAKMTPLKPETPTWKPDGNRMATGRNLSETIQDMTTIPLNEVSASV